MLPALPTGVDLDLLVLGARQRLRALVRGAGLVMLACWLVLAGSVLVVGAGGALAFGERGTGTVAFLAAGLVSAAFGWLAGRRGVRLLGYALRMRRTLERARLAYERAAIQRGPR